MWPNDTAILMVVLDEGTLSIEANSDERADEAEALVLRLLPDAVLVDHDFRDLDEIMAHRPDGPEPHWACSQRQRDPPGGSYSSAHVLEVSGS